MKHVAASNSHSGIVEKSISVSSLQCLLTKRILSKVSKKEFHRHAPQLFNLALSFYEKAQSPVD